MDFQHANLLVDDRPDEGIFRVHGSAYSDPAIFDLEMKYIFERTWGFLGFESQIHSKNDFFTTILGRTPLLVTRNGDGAISALINACRHKGATVCRLSSGNARYHVCPYHGWAYDASGKNVDIKDRSAGAYAQAFDADNHDLIPIARVEAYKGLIFGSLSTQVPPLETYLSDVKALIDLSMDQGPQGMEVLPGRCVYTFRGNWKLQMDNGFDTYHLDTAHSSYVDLMERRRRERGETARQFDFYERAADEGGIFQFDHGHCAFWRTQLVPQTKPIYPVIDEIRARVGDVKAEWMLKPRNSSVFPNFQIADTMVPMVRTFRPLAVDLTEMQSWTLAPIGEAPQLRSWRLRQLEDFFNPGGLATPDDSVIYEESQRGFQGQSTGWLQGHGRGIAAVVDGANASARALGIHPARSMTGPMGIQNEVALHAPYREWARLLQAGITGTRAYAAGTL